MKTLSICIPTYRRPDCIQKSLTNYANIITHGRLLDEVELCITDSNEDDKTEKVVRWFIKNTELTIR